MTIERFEDLDCWNQARILANLVYDLCETRSIGRDGRLRDQITGAAISIMNNIAEGFDSQSNPEFIRFLTYSRRSVSEVQNCLYITVDQKYISADTQKELYEGCLKTRKIIDGMLRYLHGSKRTQRN